jgi:hypothetical protein
MTIGACECDWRKLSPLVLRGRLLSEFHKLVVRDGLDPRVVHRAFFVLKEYRDIIVCDCVGMPDGPPWRPGEDPIENY